MLTIEFIFLFSLLDVMITFTKIFIDNNLLIVGSETNDIILTE